MSILSGEEPLIDRLMRAYNRAYEAPSADSPVFGIPSLAQPGATQGPLPALPYSVAPSRVGIQSPVGDTPPLPQTAGPAPAPGGSLDLPAPTTPVPIMDKPTYEYAGNGMPFTNPTTVVPDPRSDLSSEAGLAWLAKVRPNLLGTPGGPAMATIDTLRGGEPGLAALYSPEQRVQQRAMGMNLVGNPFEWNANNTAQLNAAMAQRFKAASEAQYLQQKGQADIELAKAAEAGKLALYDPQRQETERLLEAGKQNPLLWQMPEFKQKVGVPLTAADKMSLAQSMHPGLNVAEGLKQLTEGYAPGTPRLSQLFDASRFGMAPLSPGAKVQMGLESMPANQAAEWRKVAELLGLIDASTGQPTRAKKRPLR